MTSLFEWNPLLDTGLAEIDQQHQHLFALVNSFGAALAEQRLSEIEMGDLFSELVDYTCYHFEAEETLMYQHNIDPRYTHQHKGLHQQFVAEVGGLYRQFQSDKEGTGKHLFDFLVNWVIFHIMGTDAALARQISQIEKGLSPQAAYDLENHHADPQTLLLFRSLQNLFELVSTRNQQLIELNNSLEEKVKQRTRELETANSHLKVLAATDSLTGLLNRRRALEVLRLLWPKKEQPLSCIMLDADYFKEINDSYGHDAGDDVLRALAQELMENVRTDDYVCRLGGDELLIICPATDAAGALHLAQTLQEHIASLQVPAGTGFWHGSVSIGVASRQAGMKTIEDLIKAADRSVYAAKAAGKNCVRMLT